MIKIACPHCQSLGLIPEITLTNGHWPVACHHCHQHYYAPVISGPEPLARHKNVSCRKCKEKVQINPALYTQAKAQSVPLFCPHCHTSLLPARKRQATGPVTLTDRQKTSHADLQWPAALALVFSGFAVTVIAVIAAREGVIDKNWLDQLLALLPEKQKITEAMRHFFLPSR